VPTFLPLLPPITHVIVRSRRAVFAGGEKVVAVGIASARRNVLILHSPRIHGDFFEQLPPIARCRRGGGLLDERLEALFRAWRKAVHALVDHELGLNGLKVAFNLGVFGDAQIVAQSVGSNARQETDNHDDHHDLNQSESRASGDAGTERGMEGGTFHRVVGIGGLSGLCVGFGLAAGAELKFHSANFN